MSRRSPFVIVLGDDDRRCLEVLARKQTAERRAVLRARIVLAAAGGAENASIAGRLGVALNTVIKWRKRFFEEGMDGLADRKRPGRARVFSPSGGHRGEGPGVSVAGDERRAAVTLERQGAGCRGREPGRGGGDLGVDGVAGPSR